MSPHQFLKNASLFFLILLHAIPSLAMPDCELNKLVMKIRNGIIQIVDIPPSTLFTDGQLAQIGGALNDEKSIVHSLTLADVEANPNEWIGFFEILKTNNKVTHLNLSKNNLGDGVLKALTEMMARKKEKGAPIKVLNLSEVASTAKAFEEFSSSAGNLSLTNLNLSGLKQTLDDRNSAGFIIDNLLKNLSNSFKKCPTIEMIRISGNYISDERYSSRLSTELSPKVRIKGEKSLRIYSKSSWKWFWGF